MLRTTKVLIGDLILWPSLFIFLRHRRHSTGASAVTVRATQSEHAFSQPLCPRRLVSEGYGADHSHACCREMQYYPHVPHRDINHERLDRLPYIALLILCTVCKLRTSFRFSLNRGSLGDLRQSMMCSTYRQTLRRDGGLHLHT